MNGWMGAGEDSTVDKCRFTFPPAEGPFLRKISEGGLHERLSRDSMPEVAAGEAGDRLQMDG